MFKLEFPYPVLYPFKVMTAYSERGWRFLKDPLFFTSSVFLKTPQRIMVLAMVMALALMVYTLAQRQLRQALLLTQQTVPDQRKHRRYDGFSSVFSLFMSFGLKDENLFPILVTFTCKF